MRLFSDTAKKVEVQWLAQPTGEFIQSYKTGLEFTFCNDKLQQCHEFVFCKDFLHDVVWANINNEKFEIYRMKYNPDVNPRLSFDRLRLLCVNKEDKNIDEKIDGVIDFLNQCCRIMGVSETTVTLVKNPPANYQECWLFDGDPTWFLSPVLVSMYSLLIRFSFAHTVGNYILNTFEDIKNKKIKDMLRYENQLTDAQRGIELILRHKPCKFFGDDMTKNYACKNVNEIHHSGIISFSNGTTKWLCEDWLKDFPEHRIPNTTNSFWVNAFYGTS